MNGGNSKNQNALGEKIAQKAKKLLIKMIPVLAIVLIIVTIVMAAYLIFKSVIDKVMQILSNAGTAIVKFVKWIRDDYWIKLDEKVETTVTNEETRSRRNSKDNCS